MENLDDVRTEDLPNDLTPFITRTTLDAVGAGGYGDVWKCNYNHEANGISALVAVKAFRLLEPYDLETVNRNISREIGILRILRHNNIVPLWGIATGFGRMPELRCLVSPWMPNGTLTAYLTSNHDDLTVLDRSRVLEDVSAGLRYLHSESVIHGDITGANILIDKRGHARLIDFGLSTIVQPLIDRSHLAISTVRHGAIRYAAPELVLSDDTHESPVPLEKTDIYSFGCVMLEVLSSRLPWSEIRREVVISTMMLQGRGPQRPDCHPKIVDSDWNFIQECLQSGPELRPSAEKVLEFVIHRLSSRDPCSRPPDDPSDDTPDDFPGASPHDIDSFEQPPDSPPPDSPPPDSPPPDSPPPNSPPPDTRSTTFKQNSTAHFVARAQEAIAASDHEMAVTMYSAAIKLDSSSESLFALRSKVYLERGLYAEALDDAEKIIELNPSSYLGYDLKHTALHKVQRYDEAFEAFSIMFSKLDHGPDAQGQELLQQYISPPEAEYSIRQAVHDHLENAPLRLFNTFTGLLCNREAQINTFFGSIEYKQLLYRSMIHAPLQTELIAETVTKYFSRVMLSHRWEQKEPLLYHIQDKVVYDLDPVGTMVKLQTFCKTARDAGYRWAWSDTCCIDQNNNVELQRSVNSMFVWYRQSALTIVYLADVLPTAKSGALAKSAWNTRGWTIQEFLASVVVLFYKADWTPYLDDRSPNHKKSAIIMDELQISTGIDALSLVTFRPGMKGAREKLRWASSRVTTLQEDVAYSLFGIFDIHLPIDYGEMKQNALGRLLQEIVARSGDITALDWIGKPSQFNSCLPADITSYKAPPCILSSLPENEMQKSVSRLRNSVTVKSALALYTLLDNLSAPRFANSRLQLPCIAFRVTEVRRCGGQEQGTSFTYYVRADGLRDLVITTEDRLVQFSRARPTQQAFLLVRPWNRYDPGLLDFEDDESIKTMSMPWSMSDRSISGSPDEYEESVDSELPSRAFRLMVRLGQAFGALLLARQRSGEYKRIASDHNIMARVEDISTVHDMMDIRTLEIL